MQRSGAELISSALFSRTAKVAAEISLQAYLVHQFGSCPQLLHLHGGLDDAIPTWHPALLAGGDNGPLPLQSNP